ncbi:MAG: outer-membrane lipoprotein carrier protein LolA [Balneolales bacterium]|nr:outer-membrane lipoprotein carrier protein LolA [Balneolales bacterium]
MNTSEASTSINMTRQITILVTILLFVAATLQANDSPALKQLKERFSGDVVFRAEMSHFFTDSFTDETTETYGTIWFSKDRYRIDTPDQKIVVNGDVSTVYNVRQKRVIISHYDAEEDEFAPSRFFGSSEATFRSQDSTGDDGTTTILITSDDPFELFSKVNIRVSRDGSPMQIDAIDQMDNSVRTNFRFGRFERMRSDLFTLDYPADTEVVDLRE